MYYLLPGDGSSVNLKTIKGPVKLIQRVKITHLFRLSSLSVTCERKFSMYFHIKWNECVTFEGQLK